MAAKLVLVTGANKGIGLAICRRLLQQHADTHVILAARNLPLGVDAQTQLVAQLGDAVRPRLDVIQLDIDDPASIDKAAAHIQATYAGVGGLYGIINNAGIGFGKDVKQVCGTNYYGTKALTEKLIDGVGVTHGVVFVTSASGPMYVVKCDDEEKRFWMGKSDQEITPQSIDARIKAKDQTRTDIAYGLSKAALNAYMLYLAKKYPQLRINACTPGFIDTDLTRGMGAKNTPDQGAVPPVFSLLDPSAKTGYYYGSDCKRSPLHVYRGPGDPEYQD